ncbi:hypothetical protein RvY_08409 [Ramazzottius varieornatus]|uniref:Uncharacterized protein n=1 Tax=Ramazzottius varieornatus TaxID=947166 RepID=A0A1D1V5P8_RAMVA|nr:hypothetical protein RvY_08409 [Ramazzottius varieornatus]
MACYPVVYYKSFFRGRRQRLLISSQTVRVQTETIQTEQLGHPGQVPTSTQPLSIPRPSVPAVIPRRTETLKLCGKMIHIDGSATGFVTLTLMTVSVIISLMPKEVYYTYQLWTDDDNIHLFFYLIADTLQHLTTVFDPVLIVLVNPELQKIILATLRLRQRYCGFGH